METSNSLVTLWHQKPCTSIQTSMWTSFSWPMIGSKPFWLRNSTLLYKRKRESISHFRLFSKMPWYCL